MPGQINHKLESRLPGEIPTTSDVDDTALTAENEEELKNLMVTTRGEWRKTGLKLNIQKPKITASGPITSWQIELEKVETVTDSTFLGSKSTVDALTAKKLNTCSL